MRPVLPGPFDCIIFKMPERVNVGDVCIKVEKTVEKIVSAQSKLETFGEKIESIIKATVFRN